MPDGGVQPQIIEGDGIEIAREAAQLLIEVIGKLHRLVQASLPLRRKVCHHLCKCKLEAEQDLTSPVVDLSCRAPGLVLECLVQATERDIRFQVPAVGHLKRRE